MSYIHAGSTLLLKSLLGLDLSISCRIYEIFSCELHFDSIDRDIEGELAKSPKMVSNVQQLMFIGENLFTLFL